MSRSRNEKKPVVQPPPTFTTNDIIPGKFNENQWNLMVEQENGQDFVLDIIDEIVDCTVKVIHDKYIQSQLHPYSVKIAKSLLLEVVECRFLAHDVGEQFPENDATWLEDEEPIPCLTDSWSQGSVPVQRCPSRPLSTRPDSAGESLRDTRSHSTREDKVKESDDSKADDREKNAKSFEEKISQESDVSPMPEICPSPPPISRVSTLSGRKKLGMKTTGNRRKQFGNRKRLPQDDSKSPETSENNRDLTGDDGPLQSTSTNPMQKVLKGRPPGDQEVTYDEQGNIVAMMRLSTDKLPTHRIRTRYSIIDPNNDNLMLQSQLPRKVTTRESVLNQLRETHPSSVLNVKKRQDKQSFTSPFLKSSCSLEVKSKAEDQSLKPLPPPLADSMNISAGVVIREREVVRKGPELYLGSPVHDRTRRDILNLQPVGSLSRKQTISVSDVVGAASPVVRQMHLPDPIPPIESYHRS